jgi:hypothetical protein
MTTVEPIDQTQVRTIDGLSMRYAEGEPGRAPRSW